ncbi:MAG: class I SAM-dependent methyltransferase [Parafilimonas sp.]
MQLSQAISLIQHSTGKQKSVWADLGCGDGLFTNALSNLLAKESLVYAVDKNKAALNKVAIVKQVQLQKLEIDFVKDNLPFTNLSGILMANSFQFIKDKNTFTNKAFNCLNKDGYLLMVEYDTDTSNFWVPYPMSFKKLEIFFNHYNYAAEKLHEMPSRFNGTIYAAIVRINK